MGPTTGRCLEGPAFLLWDLPVTVEISDTIDVSEPMDGFLINAVNDSSLILVADVDGCQRSGKIYVDLMHATKGVIENTVKIQCTLVYTQRCRQD